jgi:hypothetical protein
MNGSSRPQKEEGYVRIFLSFSNSDLFFALSKTSPNVSVMLSLL